MSLGTALLWLVPTALAGATLSGILGMGGGLLLITVMASVLEPIQVVPVHGAVQLVSNGTRALRLLSSVRWSWFFLYVPGLFLGAYFGIQLYDGDVEVLAKSMDYIQKTAASILDGIQMDLSTFFATEAPKSEPVVYRESELVEIGRGKISYWQVGRELANRSM